MQEKCKRGWIKKSWGGGHWRIQEGAKGAEAPTKVFEAPLSPPGKTAEFVPSLFTPFINLFKSEFISALQKYAYKGHRHKKNDNNKKKYIQHLSQICMVF